MTSVSGIACKHYVAGGLSVYNNMFGVSSCFAVSERGNTCEACVAANFFTQSWDIKRVKSRQGLLVLLVIEAIFVANCIRLLSH